MKWLEVGTPSFRLAKKVKSNKKIRMWNKCFGRVKVKIKEIVNEVWELERVGEGVKLAERQRLEVLKCCGQKKGTG